MSKTPAQRARKHGPQALPVNDAGQRTGRTPRKAEHNANLIIMAGTVVSLFLFAYLHLLTLNQMTQLTGGLAMPDSLFTGYDAAYLERLRGVMDDDARGQLNYVHKTAGTLFPLIFGAVWMLLINQFVASGPVRWALWAAPALFTVVDLWENFAIDGALAAQTLSSGDAALASTLTVLRWVLLALSLVAAVVAVAHNSRARKRRAAAAAEASEPDGGTAAPATDNG